MYDVGFGWKKCYRNLIKCKPYDFHFCGDKRKTNECNDQIMKISMQILRGEKIRQNTDNVMLNFEPYDEYHKDSTVVFISLSLCFHRRFNNARKATDGQSIQAMTKSHFCIDHRVTILTVENFPVKTNKSIMMSRRLLLELHTYLSRSQSKSSTWRTLNQCIDSLVFETKAQDYTCRFVWPSPRHQIADCCYCLHSFVWLCCCSPHGHSGPHEKHGRRLTMQTHNANYGWIRMVKISNKIFLWPNKFMF